MYLLYVFYFVVSINMSFLIYTTLLKKKVCLSNKRRSSPAGLEIEALNSYWQGNGLCLKSLNDLCREIILIFISDVCK